MNAEVHTARLELQQRAAYVDFLTASIYGKPVPAADARCWEELGRAEAERQKAAAVLRDLESKQGKRGVLLEVGPKQGGARVMGRDTTGIEIKANLRLERVPTGIMHLLDAATHPLVTFEIANTSTTTRRLRLMTYIEGYSASAVDTIEIPRNQTSTVSQLVTLFPQHAKQLTELTRATLHMKVDDLDGKQEIHTTKPIWLLARDSAYLSVQDPSSGDLVDLTRYLVAWVTPHAEAVLVVLRSATDLRPDAVLGGYQGDADFVQRQVHAVFDALKAQKITYVNSTISFGAGSGEHMQRVRLPRESLATRSANCIDGTVLLASLLEAASLSTAIVIVPGHAFLAWQMQENGQWDYVETTLIGTSDFERAKQEGRNLIERHEEMAKSTGRQVVRRIGVAEVRSQHGITPME